MSRDIFISYSRRDLVAVKPIKEEFERLGFSCWMDLEGIESGSPEFTETIANAISDAKIVLFFLSEASQTSPWSLNELRLARAENKHIVFVRFSGDRMHPKFMLEFGGSDVIDWRKPEQKGKLVRDLSFWTRRKGGTLAVSSSDRQTPSPAREPARPNALRLVVMGLAVLCLALLAWMSFVQYRVTHSPTRMKESPTPEGKESPQTEEAVVRDDTTTQLTCPELLPTSPVEVGEDKVLPLVLPFGQFPSHGAIAGFRFNDEDKASDFVKKGRSFMSTSSGHSMQGAPANEFVQNGVLHVPGGHAWESCLSLHVPELRYDRFSVVVGFRPESGNGMPLVSFGGGWRWFHIMLRSDGTPVIAFRGLAKGELHYPLLSKYSPRVWNWVAVACDVPSHRLSVVLNGCRLPDIELPADFAFRFSRKDRENSRTVQFANTNNGSVFKGEINGFLLFDRAFSDAELDAICPVSDSYGEAWTFIPDEEGKAQYWNGTISNGLVSLDAHHADGVVSISFPDVLSVPNGVLDLNKTIIDADGKELSLCGIGRDDCTESHVGFGGNRREMREVLVPDTLQWIGLGAFERCVFLEKIDCPDSVRRIESCAFEGCRNLRLFRVGANVEFVSSDRVFMGCEALESIEVDSRNCCYKAVEGVLLSLDGKNLVAFPPGKDGAFIVPDGVETIPARAFLGCHKLT